MGRGRLTEEEVRLLYENPYVSEIYDNRIIFTNEFKQRFIQEYTVGQKGPAQIFRDAGFDTKILGSKRIERAAARWKESYEAGTLGAYPISNPKVDKQKKVIKELKEENKLLRKQIELLSALHDLKVE